MYTDKEHGELGADELLDPAEENQEESLRWLLDMDVEEPEEKLFGLAEDEYEDEGLSDFEEEVASRPLFRGNASSDDLATYVAEEIVISSERDERSDIYNRELAPYDTESLKDQKDSSAMAVDYSRKEYLDVGKATPQADGVDFLELADRDDIGEKFVSIKRVKRDKANASSRESVFESAAVDSASSPDRDQALTLEEAPIPYMVDVKPGHPVANEDLQETATSASDCNQSVAPVPGANPDRDFVVDYVANNQTPVDDEQFDRYLLQGESLELDIPDPEELVAEVIDGVEEVDPVVDSGIDYPEDFHALGTVDANSISRLTSVLPQAMDEVSRLAKARLHECGKSSDALEVDVVLGADPASIKRCYAEGYQPVTAVCPVIPDALHDLAAQELESIYLRFTHSHTRENLNDLFAETEVTPVQQEDEVWDELEDIELEFDEMLQEETGSIEDPASSGSESGIGLAETGFDEALLSAEFDIEFDDGQDQGGLSIEAVFDAVEAQGSAVDEICGIDVDEFEVAAKSSTDEASDIPGGTRSVEATEVPPTETIGVGCWCVPEGVAFNYSSGANREIFADFLDAFIEEGSAEIEKLEDAFGEWEKNPSDEATLVPVARTLHTLKGIAKGVGLQCYGTLVHNFETLMEAMPKPVVGDEAQYFRMVNAWLDAVVRGLEYVQQERADVTSEFPALAEGAPVNSRESVPPRDEPVAEPVAAAAPIEKQVPPVDEMPAATPPNRERKRDQKLADEGAKALAAQQSVRITAEKLDHLLNLTSQAQQLGVRSAQSTNRGKRATTELQGRLNSVRAQIGAIADRALRNVNARGARRTPDLDALEMDQYSELQEAANILREGVEDLADLVELSSRQNAMIDALLKQQASVFTSITSSIQAARVIPVSRLMPGLRRIVRTLSTDLNKPVAFKVLNEIGALDRDHYARCQIILEHMVRNALDHGIEPGEERLSLGKAAAGRITIDVCKSGGDYIIKLADDGRGIDPDVIRESAYRKGLDINVDRLSDDEVLRLIFHKGFSTAQTLSEVSGRGVGMDIVMSELQQLGGDIQIRSTVGLGTSFEIRIPANVTVNGALLVSACDHSYAIPLNGLIAVEQVPVIDFYHAVEQGEHLELFDMECEPAYLATLCEGESLPDQSTWGITVPVIIAGSEQRYMAIAIDNVEEALELVVRSLGPQFSGVPGVAGAATTADGEAIVALDLNLLVDSVDADGLSQIAVSHKQEASLLALVVDDSRTQRMVATSQLDTVGVETVTAENGMVAIDLLNSTHRLPDVVLLDVEMPVQDGIETLREIRKSRRFGHLPVIMVTSRTGAKHRAMAREAGCNGYMGKPFNFTALVEQISELTGHELQLS